MNKDDIPDILVNKENFFRLFKEAQYYRRWRNIFQRLAFIGWILVGFLIAQRLNQ